MSECIEESCQLEAYENKDKCVLHYEKLLDSSHYNGFMLEQISFYEELSNFINKNKHSSFCHIVNIHFPRPDTQGESYETLLDKLDKIHFDTCSFYGTSLDLKSKIFFQDCIFYNSWNIIDYKILRNIDNVIYSHCKFKKYVLFTPIVAMDDKGKRTIENNISNPQFNYGCVFEENIDFENAIVHNNIFNDEQENHIGNNFKKNIVFNNCTFKKRQELFLGNNKNTKILFSSCRFHKSLKIRGVEFNGSKKLSYEEQQKNKSTLKKISIIDCTSKENVYLRFGFLSICKFELSNLKLPQNAELNIGDCFFNNFNISNFRNIGKFKLYKINLLGNERKAKKFQIDNTSIGKTDFQSLNLPSFNKVVMFDNIFTEIDYTNIQWKKDIEVGQFGDSENTKIAKKRDTYRVLKNVTARNSDQSQALIFYNLEMENHYKITKWKKEPTNKLILWFNKVTNNFGLNWWKPIISIIIISYFFYIGLIHSIDTLEYNYPHYSSCFSFRSYIIFLNPTHKVEFIGQWSHWTYIIDFVFRILEGMLIYQTIQASRKYSRTL